MPKLATETKETIPKKKRRYLCNRTVRLAGNKSFSSTAEQPYCVKACQIEISVDSHKPRDRERLVPRDSRRGQRLCEITTNRQTMFFGGFFATRFQSNVIVVYKDPGL